MRNVIGILTCIGLLAGCDQQKAAPTAEATAAVAPAHPPVQAATGELRGKLLETIDAAGYTYLRLQTSSGETWAAIPATDVQQGTEVVVLDPRPMGRFESKTLKRTFDEIVFGSGLKGAAPRRAATSVQPAQPVAAEIKVDRATGPNARTIAEIHGDKAKLANATVEVRGQVVKSNSGILDRNWLHLRDGSGTAAAGTHDLTVTTQATAQVGDVVVIKGTVRIDKDFGAGYAYPVIVEDASITP